MTQSWMTIRIINANFVSILCMLCIVFHSHWIINCRYSILTVRHFNSCNTFVNMDLNFTYLFISRVTATEKHASWLTVVLCVVYITVSRLCICFQTSPILLWYMWKFFCVTVKNRIILFLLTDVLLYFGLSFCYSGFRSSISLWSSLKSSITFVFNRDTELHHPAVTKLGRSLFSKLTF